jgi:hypothetical protein
MSKPSAPVQKLNKVERSILGILSALLVIACFLAFNSPVKEHETKCDNNGKVEYSEKSTKSNSEIVIFLGTASLLLMIWCVNGLRLSRLSFGPVSSETLSSPVDAAKAYVNTGTTPVEITAADDDVPAPETKPGESPQGVIPIADEDEGIFAIESVPVQVLFDLFSRWPQSIPKPSDLSTFEFASRKLGRGNKPWTVKFRDTPAIRISYGGRAKQGATVGTPSA